MEKELMPTNVIMPQMGESIAEGTVTKWLKKVGDSVKRDEPLFEISTDKVDSEIPAPASGVLSESRVKEGETVQINTVVAGIDEQGQAQTTVRTEEGKGPHIPTPKEPASVETDKVEAAPAVRSSPLVKRIAKVENVDLSELEGTGLGGRITKKDILGYLEERQRVAEVARPIVQQATEEMAGARELLTDRIEVVPMSAMRKSIAEHMLA